MRQYTFAAANRRIIVRTVTAHTARFNDLPILDTNAIKIMIVKSISYLTIVGLFMVVLTACESIDKISPFSDTKSVPPNCPTIKFLKDADEITVYNSGTGRDLRDIIFEAELTGFKGECEYVGNKGVHTKVILTLQLGLDVTRGPAEKTRRVKLSYFVAIPEFFPKPEGKMSFNRVVIFPQERNSITLLDEIIEIVIPLNKNRRGPLTKVLVGFELTKDQLEFNRQRIRNRGLGK